MKVREVGVRIIKVHSVISGECKSGECLGGHYLMLESSIEFENGKKWFQLNKVAFNTWAGAWEAQDIASKEMQGYLEESKSAAMERWAISMEKEFKYFQVKYPKGEEMKGLPSRPCVTCETWFIHTKPSISSNKECPCECHSKKRVVK